VAAELGIDRVFAGVRSEDKAAEVAQLQHEGLRVAMVGSGIEPDLGAAGGRCAGADRLCDADVGGCDLDVDLSGRGRPERPAAAAPGFAAQASVRALL
jgi:hypothetical protein